MQSGVEMEWTCPACWEKATTLVDMSFGYHEPFYEDCPVCCHPARLTVVEKEPGRPRLEAEAAG